MSKLYGLWWNASGVTSKMLTEDPKQIFNCDESGFPLDGNTGRIKAVLVKKGAKHVMYACT